MSDVPEKVVGQTSPVEHRECVNEGRDGGCATKPGKKSRGESGVRHQAWRIPRREWQGVGGAPKGGDVKVDFRAPRTRTLEWKGWGS